MELNTLLWMAPLLALACQVDAQTARWENPMKRLLREGQTLIGATISVPSVETCSQLANAGFDFLWIEMEHSGTTLETARNMILATRGLKAVPIIRVPINEVWLAKRALDVGALGVIFPFTSTPELARQAVAACKYPPEGRRGYGPGLATFRWPAPDEGYYSFANRNVVVMLMIEDAEAVRNVDQIAAVPGVDVMYIGTSDLSYSLGHGGQENHPVVREAIDKIVSAARRNKVPVGRPARTAQQMLEYQKEGFTVFQSPADIAMMMQGAEAFLKPLGKSGIDPRKQPLY